jgi:hypothetical protein
MYVLLDPPPAAMTALTQLAWHSFNPAGIATSSIDPGWLF